MPPGLDIVSIGDGGGYNSDSRDLTWAVPGLAPGVSQKLTYTANLADGGSWTSTACSAGVDADRNSVYDCDDASATSVGVPTPMPTPLDHQDRKQPPTMRESWIGPGPIPR